MQKNNNNNMTQQSFLTRILIKFGGGEDFARTKKTWLLGIT
jgi:hypothetical protein